MKQEWRLIIENEPISAYENMAIDTALQSHCDQPVLRFYTWKPASVSIGRFQNLYDEVNINYCKENNIDIVRRITGGGAVFHDQELTYSLCINEDNIYFSKDLHESYKSICEAIIKGLSLLGMDAKYVPINDLIVNGKKISGCAQTRKNNVILQHGTLLIKVDVDKMFKILNVSNEKIKDKLISDVKQRVTSIENETGKKFQINEIIKAMTEGFKLQFKCDFLNSKLTQDEINTMYENKVIFESNKWNHER